MSYRVFVRNWYRRAEPGDLFASGGLVPDPGARRTTLCYVETEEEARQRCREYREKHVPGPLSRKAEYEGVDR